VIVLLLFGLFERSAAFGGFRAGGPQRKVPVGYALGLAVHGFETGLNFQEGPAGQSKVVLVGLVHGADRIVEIGCAGFFDMAAEDVCDHLAFGEADHAFVAFCKGVEIADVEAAWVDAVAGEEDCGLAVVQGDA
jgi:hypothetical protein